MVILHEHAIRKAKDEFILLTNSDYRASFYCDLEKLIQESPFTIIGVVIKKTNLKEKYDDPSNPYHLALKYGLERVHSFLKKKKQNNFKTHFIFESRGKKEDKDLELEFRRVCNGDNRW